VEKSSVSKRDKGPVFFVGPGWIVKQELILKMMKNKLHTIRHWSIEID